MLQEDENTLLLGCIADDLTGATDLGLLLAEAGATTAIELSAPDQVPGNTDAVVYAHKIRSCAAETAVETACDTARRLRTAGVERFYYKYCSTFDSTPAGNIGPVIHALMQLLVCEQTVCAPGFPANQRTVYNGNLFVDGIPLSESSMATHPLNPMTDSNLLRVLAAQPPNLTTGLLPWSVLQESAAALRAHLDATTAQALIVDTLSDRDLAAAASVCADLTLTTGGSAFGAQIGRELMQRAGRTLATLDTIERRYDGPCVVLAGSCSQATQRQLRSLEQQANVHTLDPADPAPTYEAARSAWANAEQPIIAVRAPSDPESVRALQAERGREAAGELIESQLAELAAQLADCGARKFIVAGGETSGAVAARLRVTRLQISGKIADGVPWTTSDDERQLQVALKSGNFGGDDFFLHAAEMVAA